MEVMTPKDDKPLLYLSFDQRLQTVMVKAAVYRLLLDNAFLPRTSSVRYFSMVYRFLEWLDKFSTRTEDLQLIVLGSSHHQPGIVLVEVKVANAIGKASMHEKTGVY